MKAHQIWLICLILALENVKALNFDQLHNSVTIAEQRAFIKLNVLLERSPKLIADDLEAILHDSHLSRSSVYNWYNDFKDGKRTDIEDLPKSGRPRTTTDDATKEWVKELILNSEGMKTSDLVYETGVPESSLKRLLKEIGARKIMSRWVPHELTTLQKEARHAIAGKHLARYQREAGFLNKIIAIDETWVKSYDPKDQRQTSEWLLPGQQP